MRRVAGRVTAGDLGPGRDSVSPAVVTAREPPTLP